MKLAGISRVDYPLYDFKAADGAQPIGFDPNSRVEKEPLGLFFQFLSSTTGLFVYIADDAEQICYEVRNAVDIFSIPTDYFGFISVVSDQSELHKLIDCELKCIHLGFADGYHPHDKLLFGIKLQFDATILVFLNYCDEGCYLFEDSEEHSSFFAMYSKVFTNIEWKEQQQLLIQLID